METEGSDLFAGSEEGGEREEEGGREGQLLTSCQKNVL